MCHFSIFRSEMTSIGRNDVHWAPYYTKSFYVQILDVYYRQITLYSDTFDELRDDAIECNNYKDRASTLIDIWTDSMISQSQILKQHAEENLAISEATYKAYVFFLL